MAGTAAPETSAPETPAPEISATGDCALILPEFLQATVTRSMFGTTTTEAWRLFPDGRVQHGRWNAARLLEHRAEGQAAVAGAHAALGAMMRPAPPGGRADSTAGGTAGGVIAAQPAPRRHEIAHVGRDGIRVTGGEGLPEDLAALLGRLSEGLAPGPAARGAMLWSQPAAGAGQIDHDLRQPGCDGAPWLAEALSAGALLVALPGAARGLETGDNAHRGAFAARIAQGYMLYGPLRPAG